MTQYKCQNCLFFYTFKPDATVGQCRRNPPTATVTQYVSDTIVQDNKVYQVLNGVVQNLLPVVDTSFLCGGFVLKPELSPVQNALPVHDDEPSADAPAGGLTAPKVH